MKFFPLFVILSWFASSAVAVTVWTGDVNSTWDTSTENWTGGIGSVFTNGEGVLFDGSSTVTTILLEESIDAASITFDTDGIVLDGISANELTTSAIFVGSGFTATINANLQSAFALTGSGTLILNDYFDPSFSSIHTSAFGGTLIGPDGQVFPPPSTVPLPAGAPLLLVGLSAVWIVGRRRLQCGSSDG